jgi:hypothetical protein
MADQIPELTPIAPVTGLDGIAMIAEEIAALVAREAAAMGGGKYQFHPDELRSVLGQWRELHSTISTAMTTVHTRTPHSPSVMEPGNESASSTVATAAHTTNVAYQDYLASMNTYVQGYIDKLSAALDNYLQAEDNNAGLSRSAQAHLA